MCDNGNPNPGITEALWGQSIGGCYGYSHALGGWAGSHARTSGCPMPIKERSRSRTASPTSGQVRPLQSTARLESERPHAIRSAIMACRPGGIVSVIGVYGGFMDKFPTGAFMNKGLTMKTGQCHVHRYMRPLLERIENGDIDPSFIITHRMELGQAPEGYGPSSTSRMSA